MLVKNFDDYMGGHVLKLLVLWSVFNSSCTQNTISFGSNIAELQD